MDIRDFCIITQIPDFDQVKSEILKHIEADEGHRNDARDIISKFDYYKNGERSYFSVMQPTIENNSRIICESLGYEKVTVNSLWYQQYNQLDTHGWHTHGNASFSNIAYIELPCPEARTEFKLGNNVFSFDAKEGEVLSFPGIMIHRSPVLKSLGRKTVVVWNTLAELEAD